MSAIVRRVLSISGLFLAACARAATQSDAAVSAPSTAPALPPCGWSLDACPSHIEWRFETLLEASELDADARFIAIGGQAVGVTAGRSDAQSFVARIHMDDEISRYGEKFRRYTLPENVRLVDVVDSIASAGTPATAYALACQQPSAACSLWKVSADEPDGSPMQEFPGSMYKGEAKALLFDEDRQQPCVLDKGLYCFDGEWREDIPPSDEDNDLREVAMGTSTSVALAARGVYWTRKGVPPTQPALPWTREQIDADVAWTGASDMYTGYFLIGEHGAFMQKLRGEDDELCSHSSDFAASSGTVLVTTDNDILFGLNESRCLLQNLGSEPVLGSATVYCRASQNLLLMTEHTVSGTIYCVRL